MADPLISVIIPTYGPRARFLSRAIKSATDGLSKDDIEIILVPNGGQSDWRDACAGDFDTSQFVIIEQERADRNAARAAGLSAAQGKLVRFLDDDDYLLPSQAIQQYDALLSDETIDVCSAPISIVDSSDRLIRVKNLPHTDDFITSILSPERIPLFIAHVFRKETARSVAMPIDVKRAEDAIFLFRLCRLREIRWTRVTEPVATWYQHQNNRTSSRIGFEIGRKIIATELFDLLTHLQSEARLNPTRRNAIEFALWECIHRGFPHDPRYWDRMGKNVRLEFPHSRPVLLPKVYTINHLINPLVAEWGLVPIRRIINSLRALRSFVFNNGYKRVI